MSGFTKVIVGVAIAAIIAIPGYFIVNIYLDDFSENPTSMAQPQEIGALPSADQAVIEGDPSTWQPLEITSNQAGETIQMVKGQFATFPEVTATETLETSAPAVVAVNQPAAANTWDGGAAAQAVAIGMAEVTIIGEQGQPAYTVIFEVIPFSDDLTVAAPTWTPIVLTPESQTIEMVVDQIAIFPDAIDGSTSYEFTIDDPSVAEVASPNPDGSGIGIKAIASGETTATASGGSLTQPLTFTVKVNK
jgi:hypothetical protein